MLMALHEFVLNITELTGGGTSTQSAWCQPVGRREDPETRDQAREGGEIVQQQNFTGDQAK
jgi:hypothetical protein